MSPRQHFDAEWLRLREPVDHRSRSSDLLLPLQTAWLNHGWSRILDLGSGTGSNLRYLAPKIATDQEWTLIDSDASLLAAVDIPEGVQGVRCVHGDLADEGINLIKETDLVTGSALLDLVSHAWLERLVCAVETARCGVLFGLTYSGDLQWFHVNTHDTDHSETRPLPDDHSDDTLVRQALNQHQLLDKGLGPALGPTASAVAEALFKAAGYRTWHRPSPWCLSLKDSRLVRRLLSTWEEAALEVESSTEANRIREWADRRREKVDSGRFSLVVGHLDLLALPPDRKVV